MTGFQAYLLAAGLGRRAGGPKAWRTHRGGTLLESQIRFLTGVCEPSRIAVSVQAEWLERCRAVNRDVRWVAADPDAPAMSSIKVLLAALPLESWTFLHHVDMPVWEKGLFDLMAERTARAERDGLEAVVPIYKGREGHPVLLSPVLRGPLEALDPVKGRLDHFLDTRRTDRMETDCACVRQNWNEEIPT